MDKLTQAAVAALLAAHEAQNHCLFLRQELVRTRGVLAAERQAAALERIAAALEAGRDLAERSDEP